MKNIAIMAWWDSSEYEVSLRSAENIIQALWEIGWYRTFLIICRWRSWVYRWEGEKECQIDKNDFSLTIDSKKIFFDFAYIIIHWTPWENWKLQGYLDIMNIPYSTGGVLNAAIWFNKQTSKLIVQWAGVLCPKWICIKKWGIYDENKIISELWLPLFVKPNEWWSSFGITKVKNIGDLHASIEKAFIECECILIEESIEWREFTCGLFKSKDEITVLPITEIKTTQEFFDYDAKYLWNSQEITPADIPSNVKTLIEESSRTIYEKLDCKWIVRIDYLYRDWKLYFLEINLIPWMTNASLVPQQLKTYWLSLSDILKNQIEWNF